MKQVPSEPHLLWLLQTLPEVPAADEWLSDSERIQFRKLAVPKRARDWRLGRWTAKLAVLAALHDRGEAPSLSSIEIAADRSGAPFVLLRGSRAPLTLSLSHSRDRGFCALDPAGGPIGCDIEYVEPRSPEFAADYFTHTEINAIASGPMAARPLLTTVIWSAKESALKALGEGLRRDTRSVEVHLKEGEAGRAWQALAACCAEAHRTFHGWWQADSGFVLTLVGVLGGAEPRALHPPSIPPDDGLQKRRSDRSGG